MSEQNQSNKVTKHHYRQKIWVHMMDNELANFPSILYNRIPNFKGAEEAARRVSELEEFQRAKVIKFNPDKPQEPLRLLALEAGKEILVPIPRLKSGLFLHVKPPVETGKENLKVMATRDGLQKHGKILGFDSDIKVDMVILGAVCVSRDGYRIGKGEGFADLEFGMMMRMGAICDETIVVTTVHDCQLVDTLEMHLFEKHDVPVDIIVTPTQTIIVNERLKKPVGIFWDLLTQRRVNSMSALRQLKKIEESDGTEVILKPLIGVEGEKTFEKNRGRRLRVRKNPKFDGEEASEVIVSDGIKSRPSRRRQQRKEQPKNDDSIETPSNTEKNEGNIDKAKEKNSRRKFIKRKSKSSIDFSLKLSNIGSNVRVKDLKTALAKRGVRPTDITWRGQRGFCYIHFGKLRSKDSVPNEPIQVDSIVADLQQLHIGDNLPSNEGINDYIIVEPAKAITRIEVTDVTAV